MEHADYDGATQNIELASLPFAASVFEEMKAICKTLFNELSKDRKKFFTLENCFELFGLDFMVDAHEDKVRSPPELWCQRGVDVVLTWC